MTVRTVEITEVIVRLPLAKYAQPVFFPRLSFNVRVEDHRERRRLLSIRVRRKAKNESRAPRMIESAPLIDTTTASLTADWIGDRD